MRYAGYRTDIGGFIESLLAVAAVRWEFKSSPARSTRWNRALLSMSASSSPARLVTSAGPRTALHAGLSRLDGYFHRHHLRSLSRSREIIHGARGLDVDIVLEQPCSFSGQRLMFVVPAPLSVALMIALVELCGIESLMTT